MQPFVTHYPDEAYLNQQQSADFTIGTWVTKDDKNRAAVMLRGPNTSLGYQQGVNFVPYEFGPMNSMYSASRMSGYVAAEPTYVNNRPRPGKAPRPLRG
jgi:hypothetical protein